MIGVQMQSIWHWRSAATPVTRSAGFARYQRTRTQFDRPLTLPEVSNART